MGWALIGLTGLCQLIYFIGLAGAYRRGDMSVAYPLIRSVPIIFVTILTFVRQENPLNEQTVLGIGLIVVGSFVLPMTRFDDLRWKNYLATSKS